MTARRAASAFCERIHFGLRGSRFDAERLPLHIPGLRFHNCVLGSQDCVSAAFHRVLQLFERLDERPEKLELFAILFNWRGRVVP
jgi:hypothetical protein